MNSFVKAIDELLDDSFNALDRWGFGSLNLFESDNKGPPYNIVLSDDKNIITIEIACAGYKKEDLSVHVTDGRLLVYATTTTEDKRNYLSKGITSKLFNYSFPLASNLILEKAKYQDGLLVITLKKQPLDLEKTKIEIE